MAYKDSGEIANNSNYALGDYSFRIERSSVPGSTNDKIEAICTKGGKNARKSIQIPSSQNLEGYYVEANGTTADVYALVKVPTGDSEHTSPLVPGGVTSSGNYQINKTNETGEYYSFLTGGSTGCTISGPGQNRAWMVVASASSFTGRGGEIWPDGNEHNVGTTSAYSFTYDNRTVYYLGTNTPCYSGADNPSGIDPADAAWTMIYGVPSGGGEYEIKEVLVGRFAIELEEAGGVGPGSDWIDPGDYDPDWEEGDPTHTLYVTVTGALSGRHNDPIEDPSYSYIPADKDTVKDYGCGGDGGHGGGGGAGASTVVIHKFATNQANSKQVTALARRHGYGSGGGKGGKGGDGCILVYY